MKKHFGLSLMKGFAGIVYSTMKLFPKQHKVTFISRLNREPSIDFQLLRDEILSQKPNEKIVILNHRMTSKIKHVLEILEEMWHLATSEAVIVDSYIIPVSIFKHRKSLRIIQLWHALGGIKQFGHMTINKKAGNSRDIAEIMDMHKGYTKIIAGGKSMIPIYSKCFNTPKNKIVALGMPRVDYLLSDKSKKIAARNLKSLFPDLKGKKVILYAPTFRKRSIISPQKLIDAVDYDKYVLIIKQHTLDKTELKYHSGVKIIKDEVNVLDILHAADYVITDYSATTFEAALINKPLFFWCYDYDSYKKTCGFTMDYKKEMPGVVDTDVKNILKNINKKDNFSTKRKEFCDKYIEVRDGTSTNRIVRLLWD